MEIFDEEYNVCIPRSPSVIVCQASKLTFVSKLSSFARWQNRFGRLF